ncbi:hypothetical protein [Succinivibrio dextrinosolvens]|jgi:hypothetical protein|nr:hypothetical protein [Succinivibrio dextrinosolvens]
MKISLESYLVYALSKYQKQILAKLNLSEEKLFNFTRELDLLV